MVKLTPEQVQFWKDNGYIKLSGIFTKEELEVLSKEYDRLFYLKNNPGMEAAWLGSAMEKATSGENYSVHSVHNLQYHSSIFANALHNENLLDALEGVIGTEDILLHHTKAHYKPPRVGAPYLMHQDYHYFPFKKHSMVAAFIHIDKADPENGGLCIYPGSHKLGPLEDVGTLEKGDRYHYVDPKKYPIEKATPVHAEAGDVVIFSYLTLHGSYRNLSDRPRRMYLIQLMSAHDEPLDPNVHKSLGQGWVLRGKNDYKKADMAERFLH
ncbi:probable alpha-ketoglutarate-dependent hypophosphite dioxygenase [Leguminivora glycinivorella]|uniref:probable alpha-ketoglutarate-dependent hypophosphite dioxygenase n=1 Tax=Leguminivora glycinivorella TaxID=1035111 RepID=UPI00200C4476|nr:probable alpha-ketoglutarate-dependent hypophosphite dioxygenase [Leguminivora glycinivorella]